MGLFDKLLKEGADALKEGAKALNEAVSDENKEKAAALFNTLKNTLEEHAGELKNVVEEMRTAVPQETAAPPAMLEEVDDGRDCRQRILDILAAEFPRYTVRENVSPHTIGGQGRFMDYSIVVYDNEVPSLIMMLIGKTTTSHREYRWSREEAEKNNIPFINFVVHYPNHPDYISNRLHQYLQP